MKQNVRARVASIVAAHKLNKRITSVFDQSRSAYVNLDTKMDGGVVNGFDYTSSSYFSGSNSQSLNFFNYDSGSYVDLKVSGNNYSGFDFESSCYFDVTISGNSITIFDYETSDYYNFSV